MLTRLGSAPEVSLGTAVSVEQTIFLAGLVCRLRYRDIKTMISKGKRSGRIIKSLFFNSGLL